MKKDKKKTDFRTYFAGKRITMLGLGLLGRGVNVAKFLARHGAILTVTDMKTRDDLASSVRALEKFPSVTFVLGGHRIKDFRSADMVMKAAGVPLDSPYVKEARTRRIPVHMDASLFARLAPAGVRIVGVTGTRGKSTVAHLIFHILHEAGMRAHLAGNVRGRATFPLLEKVGKGDIVVLELDSWQLQGFGDERISPHVAVFTNLMRDHMNYYAGNMHAYFKDKAHIFSHAGNETLIVGEDLAPALRRFFGARAGKMLPARRKTARRRDIPRSWKPHIFGVHNEKNIALAAAACCALGVSERNIKKGVESFSGVPGRMEFVRTVRGVSFYNDTTATTPDALRASLRALFEKEKRKIVLIAGGSDKNLSFEGIEKDMRACAQAVVFLPGTATARMIERLAQKRKPMDEWRPPAFLARGMPEAVRIAAKEAGEKGAVLLSPGAASFGLFRNEFDRGEKFVRAVHRLR